MKGSTKDEDLIKCNYGIKDNKIPKECQVDIKKHLNKIHECHIIAYNVILDELISNRWVINEVLNKNNLNFGSIISSIKKQYGDTYFDYKYLEEQLVDYYIKYFPNEIDSTNLNLIDYINSKIINIDNSIDQIKLLSTYQFYEYIKIEDISIQNNFIYYYVNDIIVPDIFIDIFNQKITQDIMFYLNDYQEKLSMFGLTHNILFSNLEKYMQYIILYYNEINKIINEINKIKNIDILIKKESIINKVFPIANTLKDINLIIENINEYIDNINKIYNSFNLLNIYKYNHLSKVELINITPYDTKDFITNFKNIFRNIINIFNITKPNIILYPTNSLEYSNLKIAKNNLLLNLINDEEIKSYYEMLYTIDITTYEQPKLAMSVIAKTYYKKYIKYKQKYLSLKKLNN